MVDEVIPQKIRDSVSPELISSHPLLTLNQTLPKALKTHHVDTESNTT
jgi:hypothetical protein